MRATWICATLGLAACDSERLSEQEAQDTFQSINDVTNEVVWCARDTIEQGNRTQLDVNEKKDEFEVSGTIEPPSSRRTRGWTGEVTLSGLVTEEGDRFSYLIAVMYDQVTVVEGPTLDGVLDITFYVDDLSAAEDLDWSLGVSLEGDLDVTGTSTGHASIDYDLELQIDGFSIAFEASGSINGYDVSDWGYAFSL